MPYTENHDVVINNLTLSQCKALRDAGQLDENQSYCITDIDSYIDSMDGRITTLEGSSGGGDTEYSSYRFKINKYNNSQNVSSFEATASCYEVIKSRTYDISCMIPKLTENSRCLIYTIEVNVGSTAYNVNFIVSNGETIKWQGGSAPVFSKNKTYIVTIKNGFGKVEEY